MGMPMWEKEIIRKRKAMEGYNMNIWYFILALSTVILGWATWRVMFVLPRELKKDKEKEAENQRDSGATPKRNRHGSGESKKAARLKAKQLEREKKPEKYTHPWLVSTMKAHSGNVLDLDLSSNDKLLASCGDDRTVYVWVIKDFAEREHKNFRANIPFDHATLVKLSPDRKAFLVARQLEHCVEVYKINRKPDNTIAKLVAATPLWHQPRPTPPGVLSDYVGLGIACTGKFVMSAWKNGQIELRDAKGAVMLRFYARVNKPIGAKVTPCGRYVSIASGFEIDIYDVEVNVEQRTAKHSLKWTLNPDVSAPITDYDFNLDTSKVALVSNDGSWMIIDTTGNRTNVETAGAVQTRIEDFVKVNPLIKMSSDARIVVIGLEHSVYFFSSFSGQLLGEIQNIYKGAVTCIQMSSDCKYLILSGDSIIYVFKNICWIMETVNRLKGQLTDSTLSVSLRDRLSNELASYETELKKYQQ